MKSSSNSQKKVEIKEISKPVNSKQHVHVAYEDGKLTGIPQEWIGYMKTYSPYLIDKGVKYSLAKEVQVSRPDKIDTKRDKEHSLLINTDTRHIIKSPHMPNTALIANKNSPEDKTIHSAPAGSEMNLNGIHPLFQQYIKQTLTHYLLNLPNLGINKGTDVYKLLPFAEGDAGDQYMLLHNSINSLLVPFDFKQHILIKRLVIQNQRCYKRLQHLVKEVELYRLISNQSNDRGSKHIVPLVTVGMISCDNLHPNTRLDEKDSPDVKNTDIGIDDEWMHFKNEVWIITPFCEYDLSQLIDHVHVNDEFPQNVLALICIQILKGIDYLHSLRVVHRDIRPENILITSGGIVKIAEFAQAVLLEPLTKTHKTVIAENAKTYSSCMNTLENRTSSIGTLLYMAPECVRGDPYQFAVDIWSFGVLVHECLTRHPLYVNRVPYEAVKELSELETTPLLEERYKQKYSSLCRDFRKRCLVVDPTQRATAKRMLMHRFLGNHGAVRQLQELLLEMGNPIDEMKEDYKSEYEKEEMEISDNLPSLISNSDSALRQSGRFKRQSKIQRFSRHFNE